MDNNMFLSLSGNVYFDPKSCGTFAGQTDKYMFLSRLLHRKVSVTKTGQLMFLSVSLRHHKTAGQKHTCPCLSLTEAYILVDCEKARDRQTRFRKI